MAKADAMVVVGAGHAGGRAVHALRQAGWAGPISLIGTEPHAPYERPPLSKELLAGTKRPADTTLFAEDFYRQNEIDLRTGVSALMIDRARQRVELSNGASLSYGRLLLTTGAEPRRLTVPGVERDGVCYLRDLGDSEALASLLGPKRRVAVIGGGFIGLEVAANAIGRGCEVTVIEAGSRLLMRAVPAMIEERVRALHMTKGVDIRLGSEVAAILGDDRVTGVALASGEELPCDVVLISIGVTPRVDLAADTGLAIDNGILVDATLRTSDQQILAAGDVCSFRHPLFDGPIRLESWKNAEEQGPLAARNMLGANEECVAVPWMWSDQYDETIQIAGVPDQAVYAIVRAPVPEVLIVFHLAGDGRIIGASGVGPIGQVSRNVRLGQMMIESRLYPDPAALADASVNLKALVRQRAA